MATPRPGIAERDVWRALEGVTDPEIPVLNLVEMGIVREVAVDDGAVRVTLTPTFSGCPALEVMKRDAAEAVRTLGAAEVTVEITLSPPWSTDWMSDEARRKLRGFGLAPPERHGGLIDLSLQGPARCPRCGGYDTEMKNAFGPTLCREIHYCHRCREPFEAFKAL